MLNLNMSIIDIIKTCIELLIVWSLIYTLMNVMRNNTRTLVLLKGLVLIIIIKIISTFLNLTILGYLVDTVMKWGPLAILIIFQPEIRSALEQIGRNYFFGRQKILTLSQKDTIIQEIYETVSFLSKRNIGALITIEREISLIEYIKQGKPINSPINSALLTTIFAPNTTLHDGAVIINADKIICANTYFPVTSNKQVDASFGTRHRAALGISEITDAITIVVSEETGSISIATFGILNYNIRLEEFTNKLSELLKVEDHIVDLEKTQSFVLDELIEKTQTFKLADLIDESMYEGDKNEK